MTGDVTSGDVMCSAPECFKLATINCADCGASVCGWHAAELEARPQQPGDPAAKCYPCKAGVRR